MVTELKQWSRSLRSFLFNLPKNKFDKKLHIGYVMFMTFCITLLFITVILRLGGGY